MNTDAGTLSRIENGKQNYTPDVLNAAAEALQVRASVFFAEEPVATYNATPAHRVPVVGTAQLGDDGYYEELGYPAGHGDGHVLYPTKNPSTYALRVKGDSMRPRIKPGEFVVIEPGGSISAGDEVLVKTKDGRSMIKILHSRRNGLVELMSVNEEHSPITIDESDIEIIHPVAAILKASLYYRGV
jgi:phage repressor protein C with HTH and peptisase S24 domain